MKKRVATLLCALCVLTSAATLPAMAATKQHYPISVEEYTYGPLDELRVSKVYQLSLSDDPSGIPTEDFERDGRHFYLLDMTRKDEVGVDTQPYLFSELEQIAPDCFAVSRYKMVHLAKNADRMYSSILDHEQYYAKSPP